MRPNSHPPFYQKLVIPSTRQRRKALSNVLFKKLVDFDSVPLPLYQIETVFPELQKSHATIEGGLPCYYCGLKVYPHNGEFYMSILKFTCPFCKKDNHKHVYIDYDKIKKGSGQ